MRGIVFGLIVAEMTASVPAQAAAALYRCPFNIDIAADYAANAKSVTLYAEGQAFQLPLALSGSGARYSDGKTTLWEHQGEATFETPGASFTGCKTIRLDQ